MRNLRFLIIAFAAICVMALGAFALVNTPVPGGEDDIIIKGGSLEIQCGKNHYTDCLGTADKDGKYKAKKDTAHITRIVIKDVTGTRVLFDNPYSPTTQPEITITYK